jgi:hypothetical protein
MAEQELRAVLDQLHSQMRRSNLGTAASLLSRAKLALLKLDALLPTENTPGVHLALARETLELGALISIRLQDPEQFTRYFQQLQPFYALPPERLPAQSGNASKLTGLYLLLLLSQGDYLSFHMLLESLELAAAQNQMRQGGAGNTLVDDEYIQYPVRLEQALMEGSYDRVWGETKRERVPGEEFAVFSEVGDCSALVRAYGFRFSSGLYGLRLLPARRKRTGPSPSAMPKTCSSSIPRVPSFSFLNRGGGRSRTAGYGSPGRSKISMLRRRTYSARAGRSSRIPWVTPESWKPLFDDRLLIRQIRRAVSRPTRH